MYSPQDIATLDIDWFAADSRGSIGQFSTGGSVWPPLPARLHRTENEALLDAITARPTVTEANTDGAIRDFRSVPNIDRYLAPFIETARRGLFAFDRVGNDAERSLYLCVAAPTGAVIDFQQVLDGTNLAPVVVHCQTGTFELGSLVAVDANGQNVRVIERRTPA